MSWHAMKLLAGWCAAILAILLGSFAVQGCAAVKPVLRTVDDMAQALCAQYYADAVGVSFDDAARLYCRTREAWAPWIDPLLKAQAEGNVSAMRQEHPEAWPAVTAAPPPSPGKDGGQ